MHRITDEIAQAGQDAREAVEQIAQQVAAAQLDGTPIVGHNVVYDLSLLTWELDRYGLASLKSRLNRPVGPVLDSLLLDKHVDKYRKGSRKLIDVAAHYGVPIAETDAHGAEADALAAARIVYRIAVTHASIRDASLTELHLAQQVWARENADSFRAYLDRQGKDSSDVDGQWPVRLRQMVHA